VVRILRNAWWWIQDLAYAGYWQVRGVLPGRQAEDYVSGSKRPVLVLPGIYENWQFMRPLIERLHDEGHPVHVVTALRRNNLSIFDGTEAVAQYMTELDLRNVVIVAHSKGGLIGKLLMSERDPEKRVDHMVAISTPFSGSRYADFMLLPALRSFSPRNATTIKLGLDLMVNASITSVYPEFDPHIPEGSELAGARNILIHTGGHFRILECPEVVDLVIERTAAD